jgi:hypothetical protein
MILIRIILLFLIVVLTLNVSAQKPLINILDSGRKTSLRGLSVVDDNIIWASGSNGTIARSINGGKNFKWLTVQGYEQRDFRDIEAFDANTALIMAVAEPAIILKTKDGGKTWKKVFEDTAKGMFLDAMDFSDDKRGIVVGDPMNTNFFIRYTSNRGDQWRDVPATISAAQNEACFAASGTNILLLNDTTFVLITGGSRSEFIHGINRIGIPLLQGKETTGANSVAMYKEQNFIAVGGDFSNDKDTMGNCVLSFDSGTNWIQPQTSPRGYRSCVEYITKDKLICCGTSGVDVSNNSGMNWELISTKSFHVCQKAKKGSKVFLAGANGKIGILSY